MDTVVKRTGAILMAAAWLLLSFICSVFAPATPTPIPSGKQIASRAAETSSVPLLALQVHRVQLKAGIFGFLKSGSPGPFLVGCVPNHVILFLGNFRFSPTPVDLTAAWQFRLRAAHNPRAPCLS
jgi:hypothetical protein